jgi:predicted cupin superfamily sugar epimerase
VIAWLKLKPHPEGGYYRDTFRDEAGHKGRAHSTAILYLLKAGEVARCHSTNQHLRPLGLRVPYLTSLESKGKLPHCLTLGNRVG